MEKVVVMMMLMDECGEQRQGRTKGGQGGRFASLVIVRSGQSVVLVWATEQG